MTARPTHPFLPFTPTPTRPLGAALPALATPPVTSPWTPRAAPEVPAAPSPEEITAILAEARERGRAEGIAETSALRERLAATIAELAAARDAIAAPTAEVIAEVATCVVETWLDNTHRSAVFAPIVAAWLARSPEQPAAVRVHPDDVAAITEAIGDAALAILPDAAMTPGALAIRGATLEVSHDWRTRLGDLRTAIVAALTGIES